MSLLFSLLLFSSFSFDDLGNWGTYEVNIETISGEQLHLFLDVGTYDRLDTIFKNDVVFKKFLINLQGYEENRTLTFYKKSYTLEYPNYSFNDLEEEEKLKTILPEDRVTLAIKEIATIKYLNFRNINTYCSLGTKLSKNEIFLLQEKPYFSKYISIDAKWEDYHDLHFLSYSQHVSQKEIEKVYLQIKEEYILATINCTKSESYPIYQEYLKMKQNELRVNQILLLLIWNP